METEMRTSPNWVTWAISILLIGLSLYQGTTLVDCQDKSFAQQLIHSLLHGNITHLLVNLWSFYALSHLEQKYGSVNYLILIILLWAMSSGLYWLINRFLLGSSACSIGFSAVILGLLGWSRMLQTSGRFDLNEIKRWLVILVSPIIQNPRISLLGHASGLISGLLLHSFSDAISGKTKKR